MAFDLAKLLLGAQTASSPQGVRVYAAAMYLTLSSKREDLISSYARLVLLGKYRSRPIIGFRHAALTFFFKDLSRLSLPEAAELIGIIPDPHGRDPQRDPLAVKEARNCVLSAMFDHGYIDQRVFDAASEVPVYAQARVSARHAFRTAVADAQQWREDAVLIGLSQRGLVDEAKDDTRRGELVSSDGKSLVWVAEFYSAGTRTFRSVQVVGQSVALPDIDYPYDKLAERFVDLEPIGNDWIDSSDALRLAISQASGTIAATHWGAITAALAHVESDHPEWTIRFRGDNDLPVYSVSIDAVSKRILRAKAL
jgi:hypothetical protein